MIKMILPSTQKLPSKTLPISFWHVVQTYYEWVAEQRYFYMKYLFKKLIIYIYFFLICYSEVNYEQFDMHSMKKTLVRAINKLIQL